MSKQETTTKQPRTVEVKLLVPYAVIALMIVGIVGIIAGWNLYATQTGNMKNLIVSQQVKTK